MGPGSQFGHYFLHDEIASGGMGTVYLGHKRGTGGFSRIVAIKRLHPAMAKEPEFLAMFLDEARLAGRVRHPNVVSTIDVVDGDGEVLIVMDYVQGEPLSQLVRATHERGQRVAPRVASAVLSGALYGLHAAHEATDERGEPLRLVHRDVSPQNILVGIDGVARVVDFGVAKAVGRLHSTAGGGVKGKLSYMAPEQLRARPLDRRADVYSAGVVLWETLTGARLFRGENEPDTITKVLAGDVPPPSSVAPEVPAALDRVALRALSHEASDRYSTAREMSAALLDACPAAAPHEVGEWVEACAHQDLARRAAQIAELESGSGQRAGRPVRRADATHEGPEVDVTADKEPPPGSRSAPAPVALGPGRPRRAILAGSLAALAAVAATGAVVVHRSMRSATAATALVAAAPVASDAPVASVAAPAGATSQVPAASDVPSPSAAASARARTGPASRAIPAAARADCDPPYVRGPDGRKTWKRECL